MRRLIFVVAAMLSAACARAHKPIPAPLALMKPASTCDAATSPVVVVDGAVQPSTCGTTNTASAPKCDSTGPIYVVDGVRTCAKP